MTTLESELVELVDSGKITLEEGMGKANRPAEVAKSAKPPRFVPVAPVPTARAAAVPPRFPMGGVPVAAPRKWRSG